MIAAANPLRGPAYDAAALRSLANGIDGPVVPVEHSYGGSVIGAAADVPADQAAAQRPIAKPPSRRKPPPPPSTRSPSPTPKP
ncbi:hypothetical protein DFR70_110253 [Nocardia tenerifensis]|uniref:Uncharacterized protein n=1 Tax=Nocardia tenerifensis TaxID=228006 RepID=A0A318JUR9_9NOCA|nr:hypothetical protein DFR70_110253 [Nocardia tenerifensis]